MAAATGNEAGRSWSGWRLAPWLGAAALLSVPALAMRFAPRAGFDWSAADFAVMGAMLAIACGAFELAMRASAGTAYRLGALAALGTGFVTLWANLAVGLVGDEGNPANLLFVGVLAFAAAGALVAGRSSAAIAKAMLATALVQLAAAGAAFALTPAAAGRGAEMVALLGIFPAGWLASAWLFRRSARVTK
ncbi:MAG: hypothetical protein JO013_02165 [Alphaproteobacteria bacterium]|nr:hypothetical protein [Alphaproteobacteria bacterium]